MLTLTSMCFINIHGIQPTRVQFTAILQVALLDRRDVQAHFDPPTDISWGVVTQIGSQLIFRI
jgi:hypothetical protein